MTLTKEDIKDRLYPKKPDIEPIIVSPILNIDDQLGISGIDLRLGKQFLVFKEHFKGIYSPRQDWYEIKKYQEEIVIPFKQCITLHPGKLIIATTLEYISLPSDIEGQVEGRSSWARIGLLIATATTIEPCYKGIITLELSNNGSIPIELYPGLKIAQLVFHRTMTPYKMTQEEENKKKYQISIGPHFSKLYKDKYLSYFIP
jgi:dCTP deaminase